MINVYCPAHGLQAFPCRGCLELPKIDPSMIPKTKSDRNLPFDRKPGGVNLGNGDVPPIRLGSIRFAAADDKPRGVSTHPALGMGYGAAPRIHSHYFKDVSKLQTIDVYRALALFGVTDPCLQHAVKKLLVAGGRGGGKDIRRDIQEAIDTLTRWQEMRTEEAAS